METLLLMIPETSLRQLYHELLLYKNIEVVPTSEMTNAMLFLTLCQYNGVVMFIDDTNIAEVEAFLSMRTKHRRYQKIQLILLTASEVPYRELLIENDVVINLSKLSPGEVANTIVRTLRQKKSVH